MALDAEVLLQGGIVAQWGQGQSELAGATWGHCRQGRTLKWTAVRRRLNGVANAAATEGVYMAARMADRVENGPRISITRSDRENM